MSRKRARTETDAAEDQHSIPNLSLPDKFEPSIFGLQPSNDFVRVVSDFLYEHVGKEHVEIEAKLGVLLEKDSKERIRLPVACETIICNDGRMFFESNMNIQQHRHFNNVLNKRVIETNEPTYVGAPVSYKHTKETDRFYRERGVRIRVTTDQGTGEVLKGGIVEKARIANLDIYSPNTRLDYRISVNQEIPKEMPSGSPELERNKDRMSYTHQIFKFDLTQVKVPEKLSINGTKGPDITHELEVEFVDPKILLREREKIEMNEQNRFMEIVELFLDNIRMLAKKDTKCPG